MNDRLSLIAGLIDQHADNGPPSRISKMHSVVIGDLFVVALIELDNEPPDLVVAGAIGRHQVDAFGGSLVPLGTRNDNDLILDALIPDECRLPPVEVVDSQELSLAKAHLAKALQLALDFNKPVVIFAEQLLICDAEVGAPARVWS
ncbi:MAG: hypothetical protein M3460_30490 [Actinomycetota bacterium]|nr:hypothetical protein [Actinomycetota bacterium]